MVYVDENYNNYKYLVRASDNYIILTNQRNAGYTDNYNAEEIDVIYQYISPSTMVIESTETIRGYTEFTEVENRTSEFWERGDISNISTVVAIITILTCFVINGVTKIFIKGGMFGVK